MIMAGRTSHSIHLQTALGYGRVFYNITLLMVLWGLSSYFVNVMPGCVGAGTNNYTTSSSTRSYGATTRRH